jgi:hypothetical protein
MPTKEMLIISYWMSVSLSISILVIGVAACKIEGTKQVYLSLILIGLMGLVEVGIHWYTTMKF